MASKCVHFATVCMDPTNFRIKILEISTLGAKCYLNVARSAPDMKIMEFCKVLPGRAQNVISHGLLKGPHRETEREIDYQVVSFLGGKKRDQSEMQHRSPYMRLPPFL